MARSFKLLSTLGEGAFGAVHLAEVRDDDDFVQTLAVKWLHPQWSESLELTRRLRDEARLLALLHHDHIVRVHGLTTIEGRLAILMEPVDGTDLSELAECPPRAALEIVAAVADALDAACHMTPPGHDGPLNVVHRDIKPSNVMVTRRGLDPRRQGCPDRCRRGRGHRLPAPQGIDQPMRRQERHRARSSSPQVG